MITNPEVKAKAEAMLADLDARIKYAEENNTIVEGDIRTTMEDFVALLQPEDKDHFMQYAEAFPRVFHKFNLDVLSDKEQVELAKKVVTKLSDPKENDVTLQDLITSMDKAGKEHSEELKELSEEFQQTVEEVRNEIIPEVTKVLEDIKKSANDVLSKIASKTKEDENATLTAEELIQIQRANFVLQAVKQVETQEDLLQYAYEMKLAGMNRIKLLQFPVLKRKAKSVKRLIRHAGSQKYNNDSLLMQIEKMSKSSNKATVKYIESVKVFLHLLFDYVKYIRTTTGSVESVLLYVELTHLLLSGSLMGGVPLVAVRNIDEVFTK